MLKAKLSRSKMMTLHKGMLCKGMLCEGTLCEGMLYGLEC